MQKAAWHDKGGHEIKNKLKKSYCGESPGGLIEAYPAFFETESVS